jgi:hypothetical protein
MWAHLDDGCKFIEIFADMLQVTAKLVEQGYETTQVLE